VEIKRWVFRDGSATLRPEGGKKRKENVSTPTTFRGDGEERWGRFLKHAWDDARESSLLAVQMPGEKGSKSPETGRITWRTFGKLEGFARRADKLGFPILLSRKRKGGGGQGNLPTRLLCPPVKKKGAHQKKVWRGTCRRKNARFKKKKIFQGEGGEQEKGARGRRSHRLLGSLHWEKTAARRTSVPVSRGRKAPPVQRVV